MEAVALAVIGVAVAAVMQGRLFHSLECFPLEDIVSGAGFGACCVFVAAAYERSPRIIRGAGCAASAAFAIYCGFFIELVKINLPDASWSTENLVSALGVEAGTLRTCTGGDPEKVVQGSAAKLLAARGANALPSLRRALGRQNPKSVQEGAALALSLMGPAAAPALPELLNSWSTNGDGILTNWNLPRALSAIGPAAIPSILRRIESGGAREAFDGGFILGEMGRPALKASMYLARSPSRMLRLSAVRALAQIARTAPKAVVSLSALLSDPEADVAVAAAKEFADMPLTFRSAAPAFRAVLRDRHRTLIRTYAAIALSRAEPGNLEARSVLIEYVMGSVEDGIGGDTLKSVLSELVWRYKRDAVVRDSLIAASKMSRTKTENEVENELQEALGEIAQKGI
jgi:hypothetical protein